MAGVTVADRYRLMSVLGIGGAGVVYQAEQLDLRRSVAIKLLHPERVDADGERFQTEARAASRINHPNAVAVYDFGVTNDGHPFLVMEHLRGRTLTAVIEQERPAIPRAVSIAAQILSALQEAHNCGVVHRDLKSDNVILERLHDGADFVKVIDFGLARLADHVVNETGISGTPEYMAPEQISGEEIGPAADIYAMGIVLYEMILGRTPFAGSSITATLEAHLITDPTPPHDVVPRCPVELSDIIMRALAKAPSDRPESAAVMRSALLAALESPGATQVCPSCGSKHPVDQRYCGHCGALLAGAVSTEVSRPPRDTAIGRATTWRAEQPPSIGTRATRLAAPQTPSELLLGKDQQLTTLVRFYRGHLPAPFAAITGPVGVGKSRLVMEAAKRMAPPTTTFFAAADPSGLTTAWYPVLAMLESVLGLEGSPDLAELSEAVARCGLPERDVPGLAELFAMAGPLETAELGVRRREATAAAVRALASVDRRFPGAVLCFADLDRYDEPSVQLIRKLAATLDGTGARVIVTTSRQDQVPPGSLTVEMSPLSPAQSHELAKALVGDIAVVPEPDDLYARSGGVPGRIEQLAAWLMTGHSADSAPSNPTDLLTALVCRLPKDARRVLQAIAVHGTAVSTELFDATIGTKDRSVKHGIAALAQLSLLAADDYELVIPSELVAEVVLASVPADARRALHAVVLSAYRELDIPVSSGFLGHHAEHAHELMQAYGDLVNAGDDAVRRFDDQGAARWYGRARAVARTLMAHGEVGATAQFAAASIRLADVLRYVGEYGLSAGTLDEAELMQPPTAQAAALVRARGRLAIDQGDLERGSALLRDAIGLAMPLGDRHFMCETYVDLAGALAKKGDPAAAATELVEGINLVTLGDGLEGAVAVPRLWLLGLRLARLQLEADDVTSAEKTATASLRHASPEEAAQGRGRLYALLAKIADLQGRREDALAFRSRAIDDLRQIGDRRSTAQLLLENARATRDLRPLAASEGSPRIRGATPEDTAIAYELAAEIGWEDGVRMAAGDIDPHGF